MKTAWRSGAICVLIMAITAVIEWSMGRLPFCKCGVIRLWSGDIWSNQNSQQLTDPYTFTHVIHGVLFYGLLWAFLGKKVKVSTKLVIAVLVESLWEILENSPMVIDRYRSVTISLDYYGDSIFNSLGDILAMMVGFGLAYKLPVRATVIGVIVVELVLLWWIRDNLTLNILMLLRPIDAIKHWQMVH